MNELSGPLELAAAIVSFAGAVFFFASAVGLWRLPDFYTRLQAPTKAATLGVALLTLGSLLSNLPTGEMTWLEDLLLLVFIFLTVPISTQVLVRAALRQRLEQTPETRGEPPCDGAEDDSEI